MEKKHRKSKFPGPYLDIIRNWPAKKKAGLALALCLTIVAVVLLIHEYRTSGYQLLYGSLEPEEMATLSRWLESQHIDYHKDYENGNLYVSSNKAHKIRTELAERQNLQYPQTGHELIDKTRFAPLGALAENSYTIALQRELARTISAFENVHSAQVHLNSYHRETAADKIQSATIVLTLEPGKRPLDDQLQAMSRLISGAVADLAPDRIRIINSNGNVLLNNKGISTENLFTTDALTYQRSLEQILEKRALGIIEMLIGSGPTHVTVAADIDFATYETTAERFDPEDPVIRKEESSQQITDGTSAGAEVQSSYQDVYSGAISSDSKLEYEINKTTSKTVNPFGTIKRLTVTMLLPEKILRRSDSGASFLPVSPAEIEKIEAAVSAALALKPERGDEIHLSNIPVVDSDISTAAADDFSGVDFLAYLPLIRIGLFAILLLLAYLLLVRPVISILRQEKRFAESAETGHEPLPEKEPARQHEDLLLNVKTEILSNPTPAAHIVRKWIKEV